MYNAMLVFIFPVVGSLPICDKVQTPTEILHLEFGGQVAYPEYKHQQGLWADLMLVSMCSRERVLHKLLTMFGKRLVKTDKEIANM